MASRDRYSQLDNPFIFFPVVFLVGTLVITMLPAIGLFGKSVEYSFLLWVELVILMGGWGAFVYGGTFALSDRLTENQLGLLMWTIGIGVMIGWGGVVMCMIAPSLGLPLQCNS